MICGNLPRLLHASHAVVMTMDTLNPGTRRSRRWSRAPPGRTALFRGRGLRTLE
ncbi:hypothetical protein ACRAWF_45080 [Streptomyces sp. L7]